MIIIEVNLGHQISYKELLFHIFVLYSYIGCVIPFSVIFYKTLWTFTKHLMELSFQQIFSFHRAPSEFRIESNERELLCACRRCYTHTQNVNSYSSGPHITCARVYVYVGREGAARCTCDIFSRPDDTVGKGTGDFVVLVHILVCHACLRTLLRSDLSKMLSGWNELSCRRYSLCT